MFERTGVRGHPSQNGRGRVWRHRPGATLCSVAAVLGLAATAVTAAPADDDVVESSAVAESDGMMTLSMSVQPGQAVPLALVREKAAPEFDGLGFTGQGIDVALIDSGVSPVVGLNQPGKVVYGPDLSNEGGIANLANLDTYGHGTHMAGIINGNDGDRVLGIAPSSRIVSLKVAGATGETHIAQVIAAIDWVVEHRNKGGLNIRVLNLSLGLPNVSTNVGDPLSAAVERAWKAGIVVVASAGNRGNNIGGVDSPAISPYVFAVGAIDQYDGFGGADSISSFSSGGNAFRQANVLAPGRSIMSFRVPGSFLDVTYPSAVVDGKYFKGSGTSQAAAVVSGYSAALLSRYPTMTPDQVKYMFTKRASDMDKFGLVDGDGKISPYDTARLSEKDAWKAPTQTWPSATSNPLDGVNDYTGNTWSGGQWTGASWAGGSWSGASWAGASWAGASWANAEWSGASWAGASWAGASWAGASWAGASWAGASWAGASWAGASWAGEVWQ